MLLQSASSLNYCTILNQRVMEKLQKFSKKGMRKAIIEAVNNMSEEDAYNLCDGVYKLYRIVGNYYLGKYGSPKRIEDLFEYITMVQCAYLKRGAK